MLNTENLDLVDINSIAIDISKDKPERIRKYIEDVGNPYLFKVNDTVVQVKYANSDVSLQGTIANILSQR